MVTGCSLHEGALSMYWWAVSTRGSMHPARVQNAKRQSGKAKDDLAVDTTKCCFLDFFCKLQHPPNLLAFCLPHLSVYMWLCACL